MMKDVSSENSASTRVSSEIILDITQAENPLFWEQKTHIEEGLKKPIDIYVGNVWVQRLLKGLC